MKKGWKKGWLCRDRGFGAWISFFPVAPQWNSEDGFWWGGPTRLLNTGGGSWPLDCFDRKYQRNFPFPKKGSIHRVEMEL